MVLGNRSLLFGSGDDPLGDVHCRLVVFFVCLLNFAGMSPSFKLGDVSPVLVRFVFFSVSLAVVMCPSLSGPLIRLFGSSSVEFV